MQTTFALAALAAVAFAAPQGANTEVTRRSDPPAGCSPSYNGQFEITVVNATFAKRSVIPRQTGCGQSGYLTLTLADGQLKDGQGRVGYIASNYQFQFDVEPQPNAISSGGYSVCGNGSLALDSSAVFYECLSGTFYNLYDRNWAPQCSPILLDILPCGSTSGVGQQTDGQPTGTSVGVGQKTDGQPTGTAIAPYPVSQITDGQPQAPTAVPVSQFTDGQPQVLTVVASAPVTQISDGQVQATTGTAAPVTQISDGQVQATTAAPAPVSQISDGQVQATTAGAPVSQISDGQVQATGTPVPAPVPAPASNTSTTAAPTPFTGAANMAVYSSFAAAVAGFAAIVLL